MHPGDLLYLPRGVIHEAVAMDSFSTHITISVFQKHNFKALLSSLVPKVLEATFSEDIELRRGLPIGLNSTFGSFVREVTIADPSALLPFKMHGDSNSSGIRYVRKQFTGITGRSTPISIYLR